MRTDHGSLRWLLNFKNPEGQVARWLETLSVFDMKIEHRPGTQHRNADALSRIPCKQCGFAIDWESQTSKQVVAHVKKDETETESMRSLQDNDAQIMQVKGWVLANKRPEFYEISSENKVLKSLWSQFNSLQVVDGILYRKWECSGKTDKLQAILPMSERRTMLMLSHDNKSSGHLGVRKTLAKIRQRYYWPGLQGDVRAYISGCDKCSKGKAPLKNKRASMKIAMSGAPMERIATDILGELPVTEDGNKYILVVSDYFSKRTECFPMPNMEAATVARIIVEQLIARLGVPYTIHSDQGPQYESQLFSQMCKLLGIKKTRTTPYHPKSDGMVERFNKTLASMLRAYVGDHQRDWDTHLPYLMMAYRSAEHETTGCTPNVLMLGREVATPIDIMYQMPSGLGHVPQNPLDMGAERETPGSP